MGWRAPARDTAPRQRLTSSSAWSDVAHNFRGDWEMLWKEISLGFVIAGFIALLPMGFFNALFVTDAPAGVRLAENVIVGALVAVLSFVCSVGNVPLAAVLWAGGISFSGVIAFIYADLIVIPLLLITCAAMLRWLTGASGSARWAPWHSPASGCSWSGSCLSS